MNGPTEILLGHLRITPERIEELQDGRPIQSVQRQDVRGIHLRYGFLAWHPIVQLVFGIALTLGSGIVVLLAIRMAEANHALIWPMLSGCFTVLGLWVIFDATRRGHYVEVWTDKGSRKFATGRTLNAKQIAQLTKIIGG